jgi:hypothetical protein
MAEGTPEALAGRFVDGAQHVIQVSDVELWMPKGNLVGAPPAKLVLGDPGLLVGGAVREIHGCILARQRWGSHGRAHGRESPGHLGAELAAGEVRADYLVEPTGAIEDDGPEKAEATRRRADRRVTP